MKNAVFHFFGFDLRFRSGLAGRVHSQPLVVGNQLQWLRLNNREYESDMPTSTSVTSIDARLPYKTAAGKDVIVKNTLTFSGEAGGPPGTFLIKNGKLAGVWLNNDVSKEITSHALSGPAFMDGVRHLLAQVSADPSSAR